MKPPDAAYVVHGEEDASRALATPMSRIMTETSSRSVTPNGTPPYVVLWPDTGHEALVFRGRMLMSSTSCTWSPTADHPYADQARTPIRPSSGHCPEPAAPQPSKNRCKRATSPWNPLSSEWSVDIFMSEMDGHSHAETRLIWCRDTPDGDRDRHAL